MGKTDSRVDAYIAKSADFAKPILAHIRQLVHANCPEVQETIKWGMPMFLYEGILCNVAAFKQHYSFGFWHPELRKTLSAGNGESAMGQFGKLTRVADLPKDAVFVGYIRQAMKLNASGVKPPRVRKPPKRMTVPPYLSKALKADKKAHTNFQAMSPSHQNEYVEWITEAKRPETREKRIATMLEWLAEGKSRNWKYER